MQNITDFSIVDVFNIYTEGSMYLALFCVVLLFIFIRSDKRDKSLFLYPSVFFLLTVYNPFLSPLLSKLFGEDATYYRFFWMLPIIIALAYFTTKLVLKQPKKIMRITVAIFCCFIFIISGQFIFTDTPLKLAENPYKVPDELIEVVDTIKTNQQQDEVLANEEVTAAVPVDFVFEIRLYDPSILLVYGRNEALGMSTGRYQTPKELTDTQTIMSLFLHGDASVDPQILKQALIDESVDYMVFEKTNPALSILDSLGFEQILNTENYYVYKLIA